MSGYARIKDLCMQGLEGNITNEEALIRIHEIALTYEEMDK